MTTWTNRDGHTMTTLAEITGPAFDAAHPSGRAWRAAGRPDYGFRVWQERTAAERGLVIGEDYEGGLWTDYETVRAWCYGTLKLDSTEQARTVKLLIWGDDETHGRFAALLDEIRRGERDGSVEDDDQAAVDYALACGAPDDWTTEWALVVESDADTIESIEAAADLERGVRSYTRR